MVPASKKRPLPPPEKPKPTALTLLKSLLATSTTSLQTLENTLKLQGRRVESRRVILDFVNGFNDTGVDGDDAGGVGDDDDDDEDNGNNELNQETTTLLSSLLLGSYPSLPSQPPPTHATATSSSSTRSTTQSQDQQTLLIQQQQEQTNQDIQTTFSTLPLLTGITLTSLEINKSSKSYTIYGVVKIPKVTSYSKSDNSGSGGVVANERVSGGSGSVRDVEFVVVVDVDTIKTKGNDDNNNNDDDDDGEGGSGGKPYISNTNVTFTSDTLSEYCELGEFCNTINDTNNNNNNDQGEDEGDNEGRMYVDPPTNIFRPLLKYADFVSVRYGVFRYLLLRYTSLLLKKATARKCVFDLWSIDCIRMRITVADKRKSDDDDIDDHDNDTEIDIVIKWNYRFLHKLGTGDTIMAASTFDDYVKSNNHTTNSNSNCNCNSNSNSNDGEENEATVSTSSSSSSVLVNKLNGTSQTLETNGGIKRVCVLLGVKKGLEVVIDGIFGI